MTMCVAWDVGNGSVNLPFAPAVREHQGSPIGDLRRWHEELRGDVEFLIFGREMNKFGRSFAPEEPSAVHALRKHSHLTRNIVVEPHLT